MANLAGHLFRQAAERGDKAALYFGGQGQTFHELAHKVRVAAGVLRKAGIRRGAHVGLLMNSRPEFIIYQHAAYALGAVLSPLNIFYGAGEITYVVETNDLEFVISESAFFGQLEGVVAKSLRSIILIDASANAGSKYLAVEQLAASSAPLIHCEVLAPSDIGLMLNTSATTGKAKGVLLSLANLASNYDRTPEWLGLTEKDVILCALPLYNTFGLNQCINAMMSRGCSLVLASRFDAERCLALIEEFQCTFLPAVPTMLQKLFDHPAARRRNLSSLRKIMTGGAPVPASLIERIHSRHPGIEIITGYGLTEATAILTLETITLGPDGNLLRPKSIGRVLPGIEFRVVREDGQEASVGEVGEFQTRGSHVMHGYYRNEEETAAAIVDGWLKTGDLGYFDSEGHGFIVDRKKDIIIRGGQNIYPAEIEEVLYQIPGVAEAAVIGAPDEVLGEAPIAYLALQADHAVNEDAVLAYCRARLAPFKTPVAVNFRPELPKGPTGKILKRALKLSEATC